jgi:hypothetical protein
MLACSMGSSHRGFEGGGAQRNSRLYYADGELQCSVSVCVCECVCVCVSVCVCVGKVQANASFGCASTQLRAAMQCSRWVQGWGAFWKGTSKCRLCASAWIVSCRQSCVAMGAQMRCLWKQRGSSLSVNNSSNCTTLAEAELRSDGCTDVGLARTVYAHRI